MVPIVFGSLCCIMTGHQMLLLLCINYFDISTKPLVIKWLFIYAFQHKTIYTYSRFNGINNTSGWWILI